MLDPVNAGLLLEIDEAAARFGLAAEVLCREAVGNNKIPTRLAAGQDISLRIATRLRNYITARDAELARAAELIRRAKIGG